MHEYLTNTVSCQIFGIKFDFGKNPLRLPHWYDFHLEFNNKFQIDYYHWWWTIKCFTSILKWWAVWEPLVVHISFGFGVLENLLWWQTICHTKTWSNLKLYSCQFMLLLLMALLLLVLCFSLSFLFVLCYAMLTWYIYLVCSFIHSFHLEFGFFFCSRPKRCMLRCLERKNVDIWSKWNACNLMYVHARFASMLEIALNNDVVAFHC